MAEMHNNNFTPDYYAAMLLKKVRDSGRDFFIQSFHHPDHDIQPNEYYRVKVERVELPPIDELEAALPLPEYEASSD